MNSFRELWDAVCEVIRAQVSDIVYNIWLKDLEPIGFDGMTFTLATVEFKRKIIEQQFSKTLHDAFEKALGFAVEVRLVNSDGSAPPEREVYVPLQQNAQEEYTFDTFVVGTSNMFAHAAAQAVVDEYVAGDAADIVDLYCGVGVFGLCCMGARGARAGEDQPRLSGIESGRQSVEFAKKNAMSQRITAHFFADTAARSMKKLRVGPRTTVVVDPPRGGMEPGVARSLVASQAARILCVSCDPATLTRDLRELSSGYDVESVRWFDMFPRTARFETLVVLKRKA